MLGQKDRQILQIKAAMWEGNERRLLQKAIRAYEDPKAKEQPKADVELFILGQPILIKDVPHIERDGKLYENLHILSVLENTLVNVYDKEFPKEIDFEDLLN